MSKPKIHFFVSAEPIADFGGKDLQALCGQVVEYASAVLQADDARIVPLTLIADTWGYRFCSACKILTPLDGYIYFVACPEVVRELKNVHEFAEVG